jgi:hypothetical protein
MKKRGICPFSNNLLRSQEIFHTKLNPRELCLFRFNAGVKDTPNPYFFWIVSTQVSIGGLFTLKCPSNFASAAIYFSDLKGDFARASFHTLNIGTD